MTEHWLSKIWAQKVEILDIFETYLQLLCGNTVICVHDKLFAAYMVDCFEF